MALIQVRKNTLFVSASLLDAPRVWAWVGFGWSPRDNDDVRVGATRSLMKGYYPYIPYGMSVGNYDRSLSMMPIEKNSDGYYQLDLSQWPAGVYRINFHTEEGVASSAGSQLDSSLRDRDVSWMPLEKILETGSSEDKVFLHREENGTGYSLRFLIWPNRSVGAFGDSA